MTDPLTGKQLVEKSFEYIEKLTRECAKTLLDEFNSSHRKFDHETYAREVGNSVIGWFVKRDKNVRIVVDSVNVFGQGQPKSANVMFRGSTKDADFEMSALVSAFVVPVVEGKQLSFVKTIVFSVEKNKFTRRKF